MKVLVAGPNSIHVSSFISALNREGIVPDLLAEEQCEFDHVGNEYVVSFRDVTPFKILRSVRRLKSVIKQCMPDVVHVHQINRLAYFVVKACKELNIPVIATAWGSDVLVIPQSNKLYRFLVRKTLYRTQIVTADSNEMIQAMRGLVDGNESKYRLLQYGIDLVDSIEKENIIYSNRLHKELYRIDKIIGYAKEFFKTHTDWKLVVGATGPETDELKKLAEHLEMKDKVIFVGWLGKEENHNWYAKSKIYISIPKHDGTAVSLLEAMSAGCIPVVSDLTVSREWIEDGLNGIIEKEGINPLEEALSVNQKNCAEINRKKVEEKASRTVCTQTFIKYYKELV